jgi:hypothetical protein
VANLDVKIITDRRAIEWLYADPYIARVGHDHQDACYIDSDHAKYFGAYIDDELVGAFLAIYSGWIEVEIHSLLTKKACANSRNLGKLILEKIFESGFTQRITAYVLENLKSTRNYCIKLGFVDEGMRRDVCYKNGELMGVYTLGLTRKDWEKNGVH